MLLLEPGTGTLGLSVSQVATAALGREAGGTEAAEVPGTHGQAGWSGGIQLGFT